MQKYLQLLEEIQKPASYNKHLIFETDGGTVKHDWAGMILCFLLVCAVLCLYAISQWLAYVLECHLSSYY